MVLPEPFSGRNLVLCQRTGHIEKSPDEVFSLQPGICFSITCVNAQKRYSDMAHTLRWNVLFLVPALLDMAQAYNIPLCT